MDFTSTSTQSDGPSQTVPVISSQFQKAVNVIKNTDPSASDEYEHFLSSTDVVNQFLALPDLHRTEIIPLIHPDFVQSLLRHRSFFHRLAINAVQASTSTATVVCWADGLLVRLSEAIVTLAGGESPDSHFSSQGLLLRREEDNLRAAAQLPYTLPALIHAIGYEQTSPGALRISLRIALAIFVLGPQFLNLDPWTSTGLSAIQVKRILQTCISRRSTLLDDLSPHQLVDQERLNFASMISVYAIADDSDHCESEELVPRTNGYISTLLQHIWRPSAPNPITPCLDAAQSIIMLGSTVQWCWKQWTDPREADAEVIAFFTANWFYHSDPTDQGFVVSDHPRPIPALLALLHLLVLLLKNSSAPGHELLVVVSRACQAVGRLLEHSILNPRSMYPHPHFATQMFTIFILVEPLASSEPYADESASVVLSILCDTVDILTMIEPDLLRSSLKQLHEDTSFQLTARFDNLVQNSRHSLRLATSSDDGARCCLHLTQCLALITLVWHSKFQDNLQMASIVSLIRSTFQYIKSTRSAHWTSLLDTGTAALSVAITSLDDANLVRYFFDATPWSCWMEADRVNVLIASALAHSVLAIPSIPPSPYTYLLWDLLRDTLWLTLRHQFAACESPLALMAAPTVCLALSRLLSADVGLERYAIGSTWTSMLCSELRQVLDGANASRHDVILRDRVHEAGSSLLRNVTLRLKASTDTAVVSNPPSKRMTRLCCVYIDEFPSLAIVPYE